VYVYSDHLSDAQLRQALVHPCRDIAATVAGLRAHIGPDATICVLPEGPQTIPYVMLRKDPAPCTIIPKR
jgi:hypothetical protein